MVGALRALIDAVRWADAGAVRLATLDAALGPALLPRQYVYGALGPDALLVATSTDAWVAYEWVRAHDLPRRFGSELRAAHWVW
jgi:hypothetical protein